MSIWIRSQDKTMLLKCDEFTLSYQNILKKEYYFIETQNLPNGTSTELGSYSTKEKALKVLDMIERKLNNELNDNFAMCVTQIEYDKMLNAGTLQENQLYIIKDELTKKSNNVFQMPQDYEV